MFREHLHIQFSLSTVLSAATALVIFCAFLSCLKVMLGGTAVWMALALASIFWPSISALFVWFCPGVSRRDRVRLWRLANFVVIVPLILLIVDGFLLMYLKTFPGFMRQDMFITLAGTAILCWLPQLVVVGSVLMRLRDGVR